MKKTIYTSLFTAVLMAILFFFCTISASAAEIDPVAASASVSVSAETKSGFTHSLLMPCSAAVVFPNTFITAAAESGVINNSSGSATADAAYTNVVNFFLVWIRRVGALIALVGGIMFGLSVKNNDGDQKQSAVLTMVAGFIVFAIALGADMFDLFT